MAGARPRSNNSNNSSCFFLPEELVLKILTLLPVISLLRCKSVCKTWLSIISNPQFIQAHLIESRNKPSYVLNVVDKSIYIDTCENSTLVYVLKFFDWHRILIVCSCNGLVCVSNRATDFIYLGNPMTRQFKKLPPPSEELDCEEFLLGFGFDDISNDYKILRISQVLEQEDDNTFNCALQAEMYSANHGSWKEIQLPESLKYFPLFRIRCVNLKGNRVLYFEGRHELLSFDLHDEVFRVYPYPISPLQFQQRKSFVLDFEGSVALIFNESTNDESVLSLWTLNDVLGNWSWAKEFNLDDSFKEILLTSFYFGDGQFFSRGVGEYFFYDYKKKRVKKFLDQAPPPRMLTEYTETLVSLEGFVEQLE